jgi:hypothetical protein
MIYDFVAVSINVFALDDSFLKDGILVNQESRIGPSDIMR